MRNRAAVCFGEGKGWTIVETDLANPGPGQVLVRIESAGLCHTDDHKATGPMNNHDPENGVVLYPFVGGHEGAGVVEAIGDGVSTVQPGDHVILSWIRPCGKCRMCVTGSQFLCDTGLMSQEKKTADRQAVHHLNGQPVYTFGQGTFSERLVTDEGFLVKVVERDIPFDVGALVGCGVTTGFGSAVVRAEVVPGDVVVVVGIGGLGATAVQASAISGARYVVAVDPIEFKRIEALRFGATHASASMTEALELVRELTWGLLADKVILTPGVLHGDLIQPALELTRKGGTCVAVAVSPFGLMNVEIDLFTFVLSQKTLKGSLYGGCNPHSDIPRILHLYRRGLLKVNELITRRYKLEEVNEGYADMLAGQNVRAVIDFDHAIANAAEASSERTEG